MIKSKQTDNDHVGIRIDHNDPGCTAFPADLLTFEHPMDSANPLTSTCRFHNIYDKSVIIKFISLYALPLLGCAERHEEYNKWMIELTQL